MCEYGIFDGEKMDLHHNRQERREYLKKHKNDKMATKCDFCKGNTLTITDDNCNNVCELCGRIKDKEEN